MRLPRILWGAILREISQYALIGLLAVGSVLITQNILRYLEDLAGLGLRFEDGLFLAAALSVMLSSYAVPIAFLFGVLVAIGRMSGDSEILAMRALGVSLSQLVTPVVLLGIFASGITAVLLYSAEPAARRDLRALLGEVAARGGILEPGKFSKLDKSGQRLVFIDERTEDRVLGVLISDRTDPNNPFTVVAKEARFAFDEETATAHLRLTEGDIHFEQGDVDDDRYQRISFEAFDYAFDMQGLVGAGYERLRPHEMTTEQLREALRHFHATGDPPPGAHTKRQDRYEIQLQRRLALPLAPLLFALIGVPLGLRRQRGARSLGVLICVALVFGYYLLLSAAEFVAGDLGVPAIVALWMPNAVFASIAFVLLWRGRKAEG